MKRISSIIALAILSLTGGCGFLDDQKVAALDEAKQQVTLLQGQSQDLVDKAKVIGQDLVNISKQEVANQLEQQLNEQLPAIQTNFPNTVNTLKGVTWEDLQDTTWVRYSILSVGDIEFLATVDGHGVARIVRMNHATGEELEYATYQVEYNNGKLELK